MVGELVAAAKRTPAGSYTGLATFIFGGSPASASLPSAASKSFIGASPAQGCVCDSCASTDAASYGATETKCAGASRMSSDVSRLDHRQLWRRRLLFASGLNRPGLARQRCQDRRRRRDRAAARADGRALGPRSCASSLPRSQLTWLEHRQGLSGPAGRDGQGVRQGRLVCRARAMVSAETTQVPHGRLGHAGPRGLHLHQGPVRPGRRSTADGAAPRTSSRPRVCRLC